MGRTIDTQTLVVGTAGAVAKNATVYSESFNFKKGTGFIAIFVSTTAGTIAVTQQCSLDNSTWYDPIDSDGNALGPVVDAQGVSTGLYIQPSCVLAPYIRYKVVEADVAPTVVVIKLLWQAETRR